MVGNRQGVNLTHGGANFRTWAPNAKSVSLRCSFNGWQDIPLQKDLEGYWHSYVAGVREGDEYKFHVEGHGTTGPKRDSHTRSIDRSGYRNCVVTNPYSFPWHDHDWRTPPYHDFIIYQLHVGAFFATDNLHQDDRSHRVGTFLDVIQKLEYLDDLGVTAIQLLPIQEFQTARSLGYNGTNYFAPEADYSFDPKDPNFQRGFDYANNLLVRHGRKPYEPSQLDCQTKQLMALIDLCHVCGLAVLFDVVYNHAGGDFGDESIYFYDRQPYGTANRSLYFTDRAWSGGLGFAYWQNPVRQFLIDNARFFIDEYHVDGFRYDEVTVIDRFGGWGFAQNLTDTLRYRKPNLFQIAEYWADQSAVLRPTSSGGAGFDSVVDSGLRVSIRAALAQAAGGADAYVDLGNVVANLYPKHGAAWKQVHHLENHDIVRINNDTDREPRIAALAGGNDARSWYARSRSRWSNGLLMTAPGIPMLFMGQEFLEDKYWSDNPDFYRDYLIYWDGLQSDKAMQDHLRFIRELAWLRRRHPALRSDTVSVHHAPDSNRVFAFQRWVEGIGRNIVVVASLNERPLTNYRIGFPLAGQWLEVFNSDVYDNWVNPSIVGNSGQIFATDQWADELSASAEITIPANGIVIFARDNGDHI